MSTELEISHVTTALAQFDRVAAGLNALQESYQGVVYDVKTKDGMKAAVVARRAIREPRIEVEKLRKAAKAPILELGKKLDSEAARITAALEALENPIDEQIKNEEMRLHNEAVARAAAEAARVKSLEDRLDAIRLMPFDANGLPVDTIKKVLTEAQAIRIDESWQEFTEKAIGARLATISALEGLIAKAEAEAAEKARIAAERAELEKLRAEQAARDAEARKAQEAENARIAAEQKAEQEKLASERAELNRQQEIARKAQEEESRRLAAAHQALEQEKEKLAKEQADRLRIDNIGFRAHHDRMTPEQKEQLKALSDANPTVDVWKIELPKTKQSIDKPSDAELVKIVADAYSVTQAIAIKWLREFDL